MKKNTTAIEIQSEKVLQVTAWLDVSDSKDDGLSSYIYLSQVQTQIVSFGKSIADDLEASKQLVSCSGYIASMNKSCSF